MNFVKWRIFCITENILVECITFQDFIPNFCPNSCSHIISPDNVNSVENIHITTPISKKLLLPYKENFRIEMIKKNVNANTNILIPIFSNYPIILKNIKINICSTGISEDLINIYKIQKYPIGYTMENIINESSSETKIYTFPNYKINVGQTIIISKDGMENDFLGEIVDLDNINGVIKLDNYIKKSYNSGSPIKTKTDLVRNYYITSNLDCNLGNFSLETNEDIFIDYTNYSKYSSKTLKIHIEYYY